MKKIVTLFTVFALCLAMTACSDSDSDRKKRDRDSKDSDSNSSFSDTQDNSDDLGYTPPGMNMSQKDMEEQVKRNFDSSVNVMEEIMTEGQQSRDKELSDTQKAYENKKVNVNKTITTDCAKIKFKSYAILDRQIGSKTEKVLVMTFDYTNTDDYEWHFYVPFQDVYQGGVYIPQALYILDKDTYTSIRKGTTLEVVTSYTLRNEKDPIELIFSNNEVQVDKNGNPIEITYKFNI